VAQGLTVFVVSWKNADDTLADVTLDSYATEGFETAIDTARAVAGADAVHTIGYCVAGTTLAAVLAWLEAKGDAGKVASATYFTAQVDFADAGELLNFIDDKYIAAIDQMTAGKPALDGRVLAATFNLLRPADLIWNYVVNNYMMGKDYVPFDLLFWNSDATSVPAKWHRQYLVDCYRDNKLIQPGGISIAGVPIDLKRVENARVHPGGPGRPYRPAGERVEAGRGDERPGALRAGGFRAHRGCGEPAGCGQVSALGAGGRGFAPGNAGGIPGRRPGKSRGAGGRTGSPGSGASRAGVCRRGNQARRRFRRSRMRRGAT
jgi:hypothetical protein